MPKLSIPNVVKSSIDHGWIVVVAYCVVFLLSCQFAASHFSITTDTSQMVAANVRWRQLEIGFDKAFPARKGWLVVPVVGKRSSVIAELNAALRKAKGKGKDSRKVSPSALINELCQTAEDRSQDGENCDHGVHSLGRRPPNGWR